MKAIKTYIKKLIFSIFRPSEINRLMYDGFFNFPLGDRPKADDDSYKKIWLKAKKINYPLIDELESNAGYHIDYDWYHQLALKTQVVIKEFEICYQHGRLLYTMLSRYIRDSKYGNINVIETGTAAGFSALCMAKALADTGKAGKIFTFDPIPNNQRMYWNRFGDQSGLRSRKQLLEEYNSLINKYIIFFQGSSVLEFEKIDVPRVHFAFLDGVHDYEFVKREFEYLKLKQLSGDIIIYDDYTPVLSSGVIKAVDEICNTNNYSKEVIIVTKQRGYAITRKL